MVPRNRKSWKIEKLGETNTESMENKTKKRSPIWTTLIFNSKNRWSVRGVQIFPGRLSCSNAPKRRSEKQNKKKAKNRYTYEVGARSKLRQPKETDRWKLLLLYVGFPRYEYQSGVQSDGREIGTTSVPVSWNSRLPDILLQQRPNHCVSPFRATRTQTLKSFRSALLGQVSLLSESSISRMVRTQPRVLFRASPPPRGFPVFHVLLPNM